MFAILGCNNLKPITPGQKTNKQTNLPSRYRLFYSKPTFLLICRICYNRGNPWSVQRAGNNDKCGVPPKSCELAWSLYRKRFVPSLLIEFVYFRPSLPLYSFFKPFHCQMWPKESFDQISKLHFPKLWETNSIVWKYRHRAFIWMVTS